MKGFLGDFLAGKAVEKERDEVATSPRPHDPPAAAPPQAPPSSASNLAPTPSAPSGTEERGESPVVPKGAVLFCQDEQGRPTDARHAAIWCGPGSTRWYYIAKHPLPSGHPIDGTRW